jgi:hypothetical protein
MRINTKFFMRKDPQPGRLAQLIGQNLADSI